MGATDVLVSAIFRSQANAQLGADDTTDAARRRGVATSGNYQMRAAQFLAAHRPAAQTGSDDADSQPVAAGRSLRRPREHGRRLSAAAPRRSMLGRGFPRATGAGGWRRSPVRIFQSVPERECERPKAASGSPLAFADSFIRFRESAFDAIAQCERSDTIPMKELLSKLRSRE